MKPTVRLAIQRSDSGKHSADATESNMICRIDFHGKLFEKALLKMQPGKANGQDDITAEELKMIGSELSYGLRMIANLSFQEKKYPSVWKIGMVTAVHKKEDRTEPDIYRPLTMLSIPCKIVELVACISMDKHLQNSINQNQCAYKKGLSTESLLLRLTEHWKGHIDKGKTVGVLMIDFRKAFDSIDHGLLLKKMKQIGNGGKLLSWMKKKKEHSL